MNRRRAALLLLAAAAIAPARVLPARAAPPAEGGTSFGTWSVEDSAEVRERLDEADRLLRRGLRDKAVPLLQEILDGWPDHLVADPKDPLRFEGAREAVLRILREGTPETRRAYEVLVRPLAEEALQRGTRTGDAAAMEASARRWGAAGEAGAKLLLAAADLRLARGEPGPAAALLRVLLREHAGEPLAGPAAAARLARALARTGDRTGLLDLRVRFAKDAGAKVRAGDGETSLAAILDESLVAAGPGPRPGDVPMLGGAPDRRGAGLPPEPLGAPHWTQASGRFGWTMRDYDQSNRESSVNESLLRAQPVAAALVDGVLYYHWSLDVVARDLYTGAERWRFHAPEVPRRDKARTHGSLLTCPAVADGVVYAPLQVWPEGEIPREFNFSGIDIIPHIPVRRLFAFDASSGAVLWTHRDGDRYGPLMKGPLRMLNATSAPLVLGDLVVMAGATAVQGAGYDAWCFAADRRTGEIRWATRIGSGQVELNLFGRKVKEVPAAAVASDGTRLFVQTNMGIVACLDRSTGLPLWSRGYREVEVPLYDNFWSTPERAFTWSGSPPVVAGGLVLVAPADGENLLAIGAETGKLQWAVPCRDGRGWDSPHMFRLLGADADRAYVAGRPSVRAFDLRTGKKLPWEFSFPGAARGEVSAGRGVLSEGRLFVPSNRALYALDTGSSGPPLRVDPFGDARTDPDGGGNLVVTEGASALVRFDAVEAYFREEDVRLRAQALLRDRPGSVDALLEAARIYLAAERSGDALPLLEQALRAVESLPAADRDARRREIRGSLASIRERAAVALAAAGKAAQAKEAFAAAAFLAPDSAAAAGILLRGGRTLATMEPSRLDHAAELLKPLFTVHADAILEGDSRVLDGDPGRSTAAAYAHWTLSTWYGEAGVPDRAIAEAQAILERPATDLLLGEPAAKRARSRIDALIEAVGPEGYAPFEAAAAKALEAARRSRDPAALAAVSARWPNSRAAVRATLEEARSRLPGGDAAAVVASLRRLLAGRLEEEDAAEALWLLAEGLVRTGRAASARATLQRLSRERGRVLIPEGDSRVPAAEAVERRLRAADMKAPPAPPPGLPAASPWRELWNRTVTGGGVGRLLDTPGDPLPGGKIHLVRGPKLEALDAATGAPSWNAVAPEFQGIATSAAGVLIFAMDGSAVGIDPATGDDLWHAILPGTARDVTVAGAGIVVLCADDSDPDGGWLTALDPATGDRLWDDDLPVPGGAMRIHSRGDAVIWDGAGAVRKEARLVQAADGRLLPVAVPLGRPGEAPGEILPLRTGPILVRRETSLEASDPATGTRAWTWATPEGKPRIFSTAAAKGLVAVLDDRGVLHGVTLDAGREAWTTGPGKGRTFDPLSTALRADGDLLFTITVDGASRGGVVVEARNAVDGTVRWTAPLSRTPALVEVVPAGAALVVKYFGAGKGASGVAVLGTADGREIDRFEDPEGLLGGDGFDAAAISGVLVIANERVVLVRGR